MAEIDHIARLEGQPGFREGMRKALGQLHSDPQMLQEEIETYNLHKKELLGMKGEFVLVKGNEVVDIFHCQPDAIKAGYRQFGNVPFLVREIQEIEEPAKFTRDL